MKTRISATAQFLVLLTLTLGSANAQTTFFDLNSIQKIEIYFSQPNWDYQMDTARYGTDGYTHADYVKINDVQFDNVGVKYKGNSSYDSTVVKNPLHIELDHFVSQSYQGVKDIKLSNCYGDPSMIREVLSYGILGNYMICPRANFAQVFINGAYIGLYSNTENIGKVFCSDNFGSSSNTFIKANPLVNPGPNTKSNLKYLSADSSAYFNFYEIKSAYGWNNLVQLCDVITNQPTLAQSYLNIDRVLWMLAFNSVLVNLDSYSGVFCQNYYLYRDNTGSYNPIVWDLNMSLGGFPFVGNSNNSMGSLSVAQMQQLTPTIHATDPYWPLINLVMNDPYLRKMYFAHLRTITAEMFSGGLYESIATGLQTTIDTAVQSDNNRFFTYEQFQAGMTGNVIFSNYTVPGIGTLMNARVSYLQSHSEFTALPPGIVSLEPDVNSPEINTMINFTAQVTGAEEVYLYYRLNSAENFTAIQMFDDGAHNDGAAGDQVYGCGAEITTLLLQYYAVAVNAQAAVFLPARAAHEFYTINASLSTPTPGEVVVNEFLAKNETGQVNETGVYADWIELYNNTDKPLDLYGLYLSDNPNKLNKFAFPPNSLIGPNGYLIIWADELASTSQYIHCNFKLSADGESVILSDGASVITDSVNFGPQTVDVSMGRCPNGTGNFEFFAVPTFGTSNCLVNMTVSEPTGSYFRLYPNPATGSFYADNKTGLQETELKIFNLQGSEIRRWQSEPGCSFHITGLSPGLYLVEVNFLSGEKLYCKLQINKN
jgi:hypothetical protein